MPTTQYARYIFSGGAVPFGGRVFSKGTQHISTPIAEPPASVLGVAGGKSRATSFGSTSHEFFRWGPTLAETSGEVSGDGEGYVTLATSLTSVSIENPPITFSADLLKLTAVSTHPKGGQPSIVLKEIVFGGEKGMFLDGTPIRIEYDNDLSVFGTFSEFENRYRTDKLFFQKYENQFTGSWGPRTTFGKPLPRIAGKDVLASFVRGISFGAKKVHGNVLTLKGFGSIHFGEFLMSEAERRITLIRFVMGSKVIAETSFAEVHANGSWVLPPKVGSGSAGKLRKQGR